MTVGVFQVDRLLVFSGKIDRLLVFWGKTDRLLVFSGKADRLLVFSGKTDRLLVFSGKTDRLLVFLSKTDRLLVFLSKTDRLLVFHSWAAPKAELGPYTNPPVRSEVRHTRHVDRNLGPKWNKPGRQDQDVELLSSDKPCQVTDLFVNILCSV